MNFWFNSRCDIHGPKLTVLDVVCVCVCMYVCMYVYIYIYIYMRPQQFHNFILRSVRGC
jgi:hypothetical protein